MAKIFLCGFMGAGKTYTAKELSKEYRYNFLDLDEYIMEKENRKIYDIFEKEGEMYFRKLEKKYLNEIISEDNTIVALGGATVLDIDNVNTIKKNDGIIVFLNTDLNTIIDRIYNDDRRPLIKNQGKDYIIELYFERLDTYFNVSDLSITYDTKEKIKKFIGEL